MAVRCARFTDHFTLVFFVLLGQISLVWEKQTKPVNPEEINICSLAGLSTDCCQPMFFQGQSGLDLFFPGLTSMGLFFIRSDWFETVFPRLDLFDPVYPCQTVSPGQLNVDCFSQVRIVRLVWFVFPGQTCLAKVY